MKHSFVLSLALGSGWLLCPESLVIVGNSAGQLGWLTLPLLAAVALLFVICGRLLNHPLLPSTDSKEFQILQGLTGTIPAAGIIIAACIPLVVLAATALLVTSGYTFNEVFLYWFPNFGFSFLLLALLTILQFFPEKTIFRAQICFTALAAGGLLVLALYGIAGGEKPVSGVLQQTVSFSSVSPPALLCLLFVGSTLFWNKQTPSFLLPLAGFVLFFLWILASLTYVAPERLASSTIPYMTAARKIMGDPGRQIMGVVVISGTCAAITSLVLLSRHMLAKIISEEMTTGLLTEKAQRWIFPPLIALSTGLLMATGLAGDELLEVLLRAALILWLFFYSFICLSALIWIKKKSQPISFSACTCTLILLISLLTLVISNPHKIELCIFIFSALGISSLHAAVWLSIHKKFNPQMETTT